VLYKRDIINFLFVISFPVYGIGNYVSATISPTAGFGVSISAHVLIILFFLLDALYRKGLPLRTNRYYAFTWLYLITCVISLFRALFNGLPEDNMMITVAKCFLLVVPVNAFMIVAYYNTQAGRVPILTFISLSLLLLLNLIGYFGLGLSNELHSIEGRLNFPFLDGFYSGACVLAILNLMLISYMFRWLHDPVRLFGLLFYFFFNLALLFRINSRINILIFLFVALLLGFKVIEKTKGLFIGSLFTIPILLSSGLILYQVLSLPVFVSLLQRVDIADVTTFNGRSFIWTNALNWLTDDQRGIVWGNGYKGHYFLDMISDVAKLWNSDVKDYHHMHLHSSSLEILVCQGLVGFFIFMVLFYGMYSYYKRKYQKGDPQGIFFAVTVFMLFIMEVDTFVYLESSGSLVFALLLANTLIKHPPETNPQPSESPALDPGSPGRKNGSS
jgi:hypothetical protein